MKTATNPKSSKSALKPATATTRKPRETTAATLTKTEKSVDAGAAGAVAADVADAVIAKAAKRVTAKVATGRATISTAQTGLKDRIPATAELNGHRHQRPASSPSPTSPALQSLRADAPIVRARDATANGIIMTAVLRAAEDASGMRPHRAARLRHQAKRDPNRRRISPRFEQATWPSRQHPRRAQKRDTKRATSRHLNLSLKLRLPGRATKPAPASRALSALC